MAESGTWIEGILFEGKIYNLKEALLCVVALKIALTQNSILPNRNRGNIAGDLLKYNPTANTDVPARHMDENNRTPTMRKQKQK